MIPLLWTELEFWKFQKTDSIWGPVLASKRQQLTLIEISSSSSYRSEMYILYHLFNFFHYVLKNSISLYQHWKQAKISASLQGSHVSKKQNSLFLRNENISECSHIDLWSQTEIRLRLSVDRTSIRCNSSQTVNIPRLCMYVIFVALIWSFETNWEKICSATFFEIVNFPLK